MSLRNGSRFTVCMFKCKHTGSDWSERSFTSRVKGRLALSKESRGGGYKRKFRPLGTSRDEASV